MWRGYLLFLILSIGLSSCRLANPAEKIFLPEQDWKADDLRLIDPPGSVQPSQDIAALYLRKQADAWQLRLDLLDASYQDWPDVYIAIQSDRYAEKISFMLGEQPLSGNILLRVPANGEIQVLSQTVSSPPGLRLQVTRQASLDAMLFSWQADALPGGAHAIQVTVCTSPPGVSRASDCSEPISSDAPPPGPVRLLLAFTESLPAYTPVQALRRWDGAHTGPLGGRHGLYNLLRAARNHRIPVLLADLKALPSLAALDYLQGVTQVSRMQRAGLLLAPEYLPSLPESSRVDICQVVSANRQAVVSLGLGTSQFSYISRDGAPADNPDRILVRHNQALLHLPAWHAPDETGNDGLSIETRRQLLQATSQTRPGEGQVVVLGGSLPESNWGSPGPARAGMAYIASHPWILVLSSLDLLSLPPQAALPGDGELNKLKQCAATAQDPPGAIQRGLSQTYASLFAPHWPSPPEYTRLRELYQNTLQALSTSVDWQAQGYEMNTCPATGQPGSGQTCLLASRDVLAIFDLDTAALVYLFARHQGAVHQLVAPTFQLAAGMNDPSGWDFSRGLLVETGSVPGVILSNFTPQQYASEKGEIRFTGAQVDLRYQLTNLGVKTSVHSSQPEALQINLGLDPWQMDTPDWGTNYASQIDSAGYTWIFTPHLGIQITSNGRLQSAAFNDTSGWIGSTEDPNRETPAGHFVPFPLAQVTVDGNIELWALLQLVAP